MTVRPARLLVLAASVLLSAFCFKASAAVLDTSFGKDGRVVVELGTLGSRANAVATQADGKIVAAGYASSTADRDFMLFRLLPDGSLDPAFNIDGTVTTAVGSADDEALAVAVQADGKIVAAGYSSNGENRDFAIVRYNSDGSIDRSFGNEGMAVTAVGSSHDEITGIVAQEDGGILITGVAQGADGKVAVLARYLADGSPDTAFADEGFSLSAVGVDAQAEAVALGKDGRILLSGTYSDGQRRGLMLLGFDKNGRLDKTFGKQGIAVPADSSVFSEGYGMFVNEDGTILVVGSVGEDGSRDSALFRFTADGQPDSSFESNGQLVTSAGSGDDVLHGVVVVDETIAAAGFKAEEEQREFLLITYSKKTGDAEENSGSMTMQTVTGFGGNDTSTALAAVSGQSVVAVGESESAAGSGAAVSKYTMAAADSTSAASSSVLSAGSEYVWTGSPYDVTRTTAILPAEVRSGLSGTISKRGIVFGTMPNPSLKDSSSASGDGSGAPVMSNLSPNNGAISTDSATLSLATDVNATCKYDTTAGTAYDQMEATFSDTGAKSHSQLVTGLQDGEKKYYVRCKNTSSGTVNTTDGVISFTVKIGTDSTDTSGSTGSTAAGTSTTTGGNTASNPTLVSITDSSTPVQSNVSSGIILHQFNINNTEKAKLSVTTEKTATCRYSNEAGQSFDNMIDFSYSSLEGKNHYSVINLKDIGGYDYNVRCKDAYNNSSEIEISFIATPVVIKSQKVSGDKLSILTDVEADCRYSGKTGESYDEMTDYFTTTDGKNHEKTFLAGKHTVYIICQDRSTYHKQSLEAIEITFTADGAPITPPEPRNSSDQLINTALRNVGNFFVGTAVAQTSTPSTTDSEENSTSTTTTTGSSSSNTTSATTTTSSTTKFLENGETEEGGGSGAFSSKLTNLKPGTFFYARAYAISDGVTYYGNQVGFRTADSCFIATAAFGSVFHPAVQVLRDFRNQFLSGNAVSRSAVELYYQVSPSLADLVSQHSGLRTAVRLLLLPVTGVAWLILQLGLWVLLIPAAGWLLQQRASVHRK